MQSSGWLAIPHVRAWTLARGTPVRAFGPSPKSIQACASRAGQETEIDLHHVYLHYTMFC